MSFLVSLISPCLVLMLVSAQPVAAQIQLELLDESELRIDGSSTVNSFTCNARFVSGNASLHAIGANRQGTDSAQVRVPVNRFDCGKERMNADFYEAMKADAFPYILFELIDAELVEGKAESSDLRLLYAAGNLSIAGTTRTIQISVRGKQLAEDLYQASGNIQLKMSDFGIDPPTALFGLIKADDKITVHFDLVAATKHQDFTG